MAEGQSMTVAEFVARRWMVGLRISFVRRSRWSPGS